MNFSSLFFYQKGDVMKAILIMDMPDSCDKCPLFCSHYSDMCCRGLYSRTIDYPYSEKFRQEWCPLKELPEKKQEKYGLCRQNSSGCWDTYGEKVDSVAVGYNQCLVDICEL